MADVATSRAGKPVNVGDQVSVVGTVTVVSSTGPSATITVLLGSGGTVSVKASDLYNAQTS